MRIQLNPKNNFIDGNRLFYSGQCKIGLSSRALGFIEI